MTGLEIAVFTWVSAAKVYWPVEGKRAGLNIPVMLKKPCILSPSGQYVLSTFWDKTAAKQEQDITYLTDLFEGRTRAIFKNSVLTEAAVWTPDGSRCYFAYVINKDVPDSIYDVPTSHVMCYDIKKDACTEVATVNGYAFTFMKYSESHGCISARALVPDGSDGHLCIISLKDNTHTILKQRMALEHVFDSTGNRLFYESIDNHRFTLKVLDMKTRNVETLLTGGDTYSFDPAWTPDGSRAALMWGQRPALFDVKTKTLTSIEWFLNEWNVDGLCHQLVWSDSGRYLAGYWQPMSPSRMPFVADMERREVVKLDTAEHPFPIRIIEDPATVARLKEAWWVKESLKDPRGGNPPKAIIEK
jgi:hypothetical protein